MILFNNCKINDYSDSTLTKFDLNYSRIKSKTRCKSSSPNLVAHSCYFRGENVVHCRVRKTTSLFPQRKNRFPFSLGRRGIIFAAKSVIPVRFHLNVNRQKIHAKFNGIATVGGARGG